MMRLHRVGVKTGRENTPGKISSIRPWVSRSFVVGGGECVSE